MEQLVFESLIEFVHFDPCWTMTMLLLRPQAVNMFDYQLLV